MIPEPQKTEYLYLFNSAFRTEYSLNVIRTLALPHGALNEYSYRTSGLSVNLSQEALARVSILPINTPVAIVFIDRFAESGYFYHSLRRGRLVRTYAENDRRVFVVQLTTYAIAKDAHAFSEALAADLVTGSALTVGAPRATGQDREDKNDGQYAVVSSTDLCSTQLCDSSEASWVELTRRLDRTRAFRSTAQRPVVYARLNVFPERTDLVPLAATLSDDQARIQLERNRRYRFVASYRFPLQASDTSAAVWLQVNLGKNLISHGHTPIFLAAESRRVEIGFHPEPFADASVSNLGITCTPTQTGAEILGPTVNIPLLLKVPLRARLSLLPLLLLYVGGNVLGRADASKWGLGPHASLMLALAGAACEVGALYLMFAWFGKKFV